MFQIKSEIMIYALIGVVFFLILNLKTLNTYHKILKHDEQMYTMARFRSSLFDDLIENYNRISKTDAIEYFKLINFTSYSISNHKVFYYDIFNLMMFIKSIDKTKIEISNTELMINKIKNKKIKHRYDEFSKLVILGITNLNVFKILVFLSKLTFFIEWIKPKNIGKKASNIVGSIEWYNNKNTKYSFG